MALDKAQLITDLETLFNEAETMASTSTTAQVKTEMATKMANAIEAFVKSGSVILASGTVVIATNLTTGAGANPAVVNGTIE